jgi:hypothetical protein
MRKGIGECGIGDESRQIGNDSKVCEIRAIRRGKLARRFATLFPALPGWCNLVARQPLELVILVRVQAPEPKFFAFDFPLRFSALFAREEKFGRGCLRLRGAPNNLTRT